MSVYPPREDSFFIKEYLEELELEGKKVLDLGTGSGILAFEMAEKGAEVTAVDTNPEAIEEVKEKASERRLQIEAFRSDLFENVEDQFELIVFNPPYLPGERMEGDEKWRGGKDGIEVLESFLEKVDTFLEQGGKALVILSSRSEISPVVEEFSLEIVDEKELWFETIYLASYS